MAWNPKQAEIAAIDKSGYWCIVSDISDAKNVAKSVEKPTKVGDEDEELLNDEEVGLVLLNR